VLDRLVVSPCFRLDPGLYDALASVQSELDEVSSVQTMYLI